MGGGIAQDIAVQHPERVLSLTLIATTAAFDRSDPAPAAPTGAARSPRPSSRSADDLGLGRRATRSSTEMVEVHRPYAGSLGLDEERVRAISRIVVDRTPDVQASVTNHWIVVGGGEEDPHTMAEIDAPTLVLHGTDDPLFPLPHGQALAAEIRGARLVTLEGMGHEVPPPRRSGTSSCPAIVEHTTD